MARICYKVHLPRGSELRCLPAEYESLDEAKRAFESTRGVARWGLVAVHGPGEDEVPRFVTRAFAREAGVTWSSLLPSAVAQAPPPDAPRVALQEQRMTSLLATRLGFFTAEEVVRHVSARFQSTDFRDANKLAELREFLRRGLLAYMEPSAAEDMAAKCAEVG